MEWWLGLYKFIKSGLFLGKGQVMEEKHMESDATDVRPRLMDGEEFRLSCATESAPFDISKESVRRMLEKIDAGMGSL